MEEFEFKTEEFFLELTGAELSIEDGLSVQDQIINCEAGGLLYLDYPSCIPEKNLYIVRNCEGEAVGYLPQNIVQKFKESIESGNIFEFVIDEISGDYGELSCFVKVKHQIEYPIEIKVCA